MTNARNARALTKALRLSSLLLALLLLLPALPAFTPAARAGDDPTEEKPDGKKPDEEKPGDEAKEGEKEEVKRAELPWIRDVAEAKAKAAKEGKDLFIDFTGSDWCGWCMRLEDEVLTHASFVDAATKDFVFLYLDFPHGPEKMAEVVDPEENTKLKDEFGVEGFPTIVLATAAGDPYARTGYQEGGPEAYLENLTHLREEGQSVKRLLADTKHQDADALKAAFPVLAENGFLGYPAYDWTLGAVEKLDPKGDLDLLKYVQEERERRLAQAEWEGLQKLIPQGPEQKPDHDAIIAYLKASKHLAGPQFLNLVFGLSNWLLNQGRPEDAKALLERGAQDPLAKEHPKAAEILEALTKKADELIEAAKNLTDDDGEDAPDDDGGDDGDDGGK